MQLTRGIGATGSKTSSRQVQRRRSLVSAHTPLRFRCSPPFNRLAARTANNAASVELLIGSLRLRSKVDWQCVKPKQWETTPNFLFRDAREDSEETPRWSDDVQTLGSSWLFWLDARSEGRLAGIDHCRLTLSRWVYSKLTECHQLGPIRDQLRRSRWRFDGAQDRIWLISLGERNG
jgi:hypothetical protein